MSSLPGLLADVRDFLWGPWLLILLVGTGRDARRAQHGPWSPFELGLAGLHQECVSWLHERGVAVLGSDGVSDALPGSGIENWVMRGACSETPSRAPSSALAISPRI